MRQIVFIAILASMGLVAHAQNAGEPHRIPKPAISSGKFALKMKTN